MTTGRVKLVSLAVFVSIITVLTLIFRANAPVKFNNFDDSAYLNLQLTPTQIEEYLSNLKTKAEQNTQLQQKLKSKHDISITVDYRTFLHRLLKADERRSLSLDGPFEVHNILTEEAICANLFRIGRIGDGGKWICGPQFIAEWDRKCVLYSFGIHEDPSFEEEMAQFTNKACDIVAVDMKRFPDSISRLEAIGATYVETKLANETTHNQTTVRNLMKQLNHTYIDILKIDIEGAEYELADELFDMKVCQMMIELHVEDPSGFSKYFDFLRNASKAGYLLIHHESNIASILCLEVTLMHSSCFHRFGGVLEVGKFLN